MGYMNDFFGLSGMRPRAVAVLRGQGATEETDARIWFYQTPVGILITARVKGLPKGSYKIKLNYSGGVMPFVLSLDESLFYTALTNMFSIEQLVGKKAELMQNNERSILFGEIKG